MSTRQAILDAKHRGPMENQIEYLVDYARGVERAVSEKRPGLAIQFIERIEHLLPRLKSEVNHERLYGRLNDRKDGERQ